MTAESKLFGHPVRVLNGIWVYKDTMEPVSGNDRPCKHCGEPEVNSTDACIGRLPDTENACCGHGDANEAYIIKDSGAVYKGGAAITEIKRMIMGWDYVQTK